MVCILSKQAPFHSSALRDCAHAVPARPQHACRNSCAHVCAPQSREATHAAHGAPNSAARRARPAFLPARDTLRFLCPRPAPARTRPVATAGPAERQRAPDAALSLSGNTSTQDTQYAFPPALRASQPAPCARASSAPAPPLSAPGPALCASGPAPALHRKTRVHRNEPSMPRLPASQTAGPLRRGLMLNNTEHLFKSCSAGSTLSSTYSPRGARCPCFCNGKSPLRRCENAHPPDG